MKQKLKEYSCVAITEMRLFTKAKNLDEAKKNFKKGKIIDQDFLQNLPINLSTVELWED